jgi:16S rRNA C967 or C1407 C5-methylase (RsmB/RsmF family)
MTYSTCTLHTAENEVNVAWALKAYPCLRLAEPAIKVGGAGRQNAGLTEEERHRVQRFGPGTGQDTNGFFVAVFDKIGRVTEDMGGSGGAVEPPVAGAGVT